MFLGTINTQSIRRHFKFTCRIPEAQERKDPHQDADSLGLQTFERTDVHCLRATEPVSQCSFLVYFLDSLIPQPVAEVYSLDHGRGPFVAVDECQRLENIFDVAMAPVLAFDSRDRCDV